MVENKFDGTGIYTIENVGQYEGKFKNSAFHGQGNLVFSQVGDIYSGNWKNGQIHGPGKYTYSNKEEYEGGF